MARTGARPGAGGPAADLWLSDPQRHVDVVARLAGAGAVRGRGGRAGVAIGLFRDGWIGDSRAACEKLWLPHALAVHRLYFNVGVYRAEFEPWVGQVRSRAEFTAELWRRAGCSTATARTCGPRSPNWRDRTRMEYLALRMRQPGGPGHEATLTALARFGEEVIGPMGGTQ